MVHYTQGKDRGCMQQARPLEAWLYGKQTTLTGLEKHGSNTYVDPYSVIYGSYSCEAEGASKSNSCTLFSAHCTEYM